jgi:hypothetical protein
LRENNKRLERGKGKYMNAEQKPKKENKLNRIIRSSGEEILIPPPDDGVCYSFVELSHFIGGGLIELVYIDRDALMIVDENYLAKELPFNSKATRLYREMALRNGHLSDHVVLGDVAIIAQDQIQ